jgi:hypothetical protein
MGKTLAELALCLFFTSVRFRLPPRVAHAFDRGDPLVRQQRYFLPGVFGQP